MAVLYRHIRIDKNEPFYIGIGKEYKRAYYIFNRNNIWKRIVDKTDYLVDILFDDLTWEEACDKEKEFIKLYGRIDLKTGTLANLTDGGEGSLGLKHSDETKNKISKLKKGNTIWIGKNHKEETKNKISKSKKGISVNKGKKLGDIPWNKGKSRFDINEIMKLYESGIGPKKISIIMGTDSGTISRYIKNYKNKNE